MSSHQPRGPVRDAAREADHDVLPDIAWASAGGGVVLAAATLLHALAVSSGGLRLDPLTPAGAAVPTWSYPSELAALFLAGFLVVLVARSLTAQAR
jgi:hypothetical protein